MIDSKSEKARLDNDANEVLPVFIWEKLHTSQIRKQAEEIYELTPPRSFGEVRQFFTFDGIGLKGEFPWKEGKTVLCFRGDGAYPAFYSFDFI
jgi:hypothetical protein